MKRLFTLYFIILIAGTLAEEKEASKPAQEKAKTMDADEAEVSLPDSFNKSSYTPTATRPDAS